MQSEREPQPYVCTVLIRMPADDGHALVPAEVVEFLIEHGAELLEWHDEQLIGDESWEAS